MRIRGAGEPDRAVICGIHAAAFGPEQGPEIATLVDGLLDDETARPLLSLAAEQDGRLVGHVLFTAVSLRPRAPAVAARILAPLAVPADARGDGVGTALIEEGLQRLAAAGVDLVFVLGQPGYYSTFGFRPAAVRGFEAPYPIPPAQADAWMVRALTPGVIGAATGTVRCAEVLSDPRHWVE